MNPVLTNSPDAEFVYKDAVYFSGHKFVGGPGRASDSLCLTFPLCLMQAPLVSSSPREGFFLHPKRRLPSKEEALSSMSQITINGRSPPSPPSLSSLPHLSQVPLQQSRARRGRDSRNHRRYQNRPRLPVEATRWPLSDP
jgi:hypothetical protein